MLAVVARSAFQSQNVKKHLRVGALLEVDMSKKCASLWNEANFQVKMYSVGPLLDVGMLKKCRPLWQEAHFEVKSQAFGLGPLLEVQTVKK